MITLTDMLPKRIADRIDTAGPFPSRPHTPVEGRCWMYKGWRNSAGYLPGYVQHPLVDYLINEGALKQEADHD